MPVIGGLQHCYYCWARLRARLTGQRYHPDRRELVDRILEIEDAGLEIFFRIFPPSSIARYLKVGQQIGAGGYGTVFRGSPTPAGSKALPALEQGKAYAVKRMELGDPSAGLVEDIGRSMIRVSLERHMEFIRDMTKPDVSNAGVIPFRAFIVEVPRYMYQVMDLLEGPDLFDFLATRTEAVPESQVASLMWQMFTAMDHLHRSVGILHRDIKPENFGFVSPVPALGSSEPLPPLKLFDLGLAWLLDEALTESTAKKLFFTTQGGTALYMAPEMWDSQCGAPSDVWGGGLVSYLLLGLDLPFGLLGSTDPRTKINEIPLAFSSGFAGVSPIAQNLVASMLEKVPDMRCTTSEILASPWFSAARLATARPPDVPALFSGKASRSRKTGDPAVWATVTSFSAVV